ncbi:MAG: hypothetical protein HY082_03445 [Gammaproteobacteria bacterium]|nr:hypothetical protein [Gammaproteobacteria bacterium]
MNQNESISDEMLSAFLDNQLDARERVQVLEALQRDKALAARVCELRQDMELVTSAYRNPPYADARPTAVRRARRGWRAAAAAALLVTGVATGWMVHAWRADGMGGAPLQDIAQLNPSAPGTGRIILHISSLEPARAQGALDSVEQLLRASRSRGEPVQVEVIANAEGLGLLREGTPYAGRIQSLTARYDNVSFLACGIAMENARLSENAEIKLIPQARRVSAALEQILTRLKDGWTYVRG